MYHRIGVANRAYHIIQHFSSKSLFLQNKKGAEAPSFDFHFAYLLPFHGVMNTNRARNRKMSPKMAVDMKSDT